jgi:hypothetical protein
MQSNVGQIPFSEGVLDPDPRGGLQIWEFPDPNLRYTIGVDTAGGSAAGDWSVAQVIENRTCAQVACWRVHRDPVLWGIDVARLAVFYSQATLAIETGASAHGLSCANAARAWGYNMIWYRTVQAQLHGNTTDKLGFRTDARTKPLLIDRMRSALHEGYLIRDIRTLQELRKLKLDDAGKLVSDDHDDTFMALAIAYLVRDEAFLRGRASAPKRAPHTIAEKEWAQWEDTCGDPQPGNDPDFCQGL